MLTAFVPPVEMMRKTMSVIPFLVAARWIDGNHMFSKAWRVNTLGDPLMLCPPKNVVQRTMSPIQKRPDYQSVKEIARDAMRLVSRRPSDETIANAIQTLTILGQDSMCVELWNVATSSGNAGQFSAHAALPALFR